MSSPTGPHDAAAHGAAGLEMHPKPTLLSDFILGSQDGIVNVLGIILGLSAATHDVRIILVATLAALGAESIAMGAVAYTSTLSRRRLYLSEVRREQVEMRDVPHIERAEVRTVLIDWGYEGAELEQMLDGICRNPKAMLEFMMAFELKLAPVEATAPRASAYVVGGATVLGHLIPLVPFFFVGSDILLGATLSVVASGVSLFAIGWYEATVTVGRWWSNGLQMVVIGLAGGFAGYLIGHFIGAAPGL
ncbi:MAG: VIT1/CCC1 transporter family protein [Thermoplasmata archaeon]